MTALVNAGPLHVGFIGIGNMGLAMALRLLDLGHRVAVCDQRAEPVAAAVAAGAVAAPTPAALGAVLQGGAGLHLVVVAVVDGAQTREVLFGEQGVAAALPSGGTVMLCPTIAPADTEACAAGLAARGLHCLDAPMSGGPARARDGSMSLMLACSDAQFAQWQPLLATMASRLFRVGTRAGDGARTKLVNNLLAAVNLAGAAEALVLAERLGLDAATTMAVIEQSSGQSWIGTDRLQRALAGDTTPRAHMGLLAKDSALALQAAAAAQVQPVLGKAAAAHFAAALQAGLGEADDAALWGFLADRLPPPPRVG